MRFGGGGEVKGGLARGNLRDGEEAADGIGGEWRGRGGRGGFGVNRVAGFDEPADVELGQRWIEQRQGRRRAAADVKLAVGPEGEQICGGGTIEAGDEQIL